MKHALFICLAMLGFAFTAQAAMPRKLEIQLLIYSGRPNPTITVTDPAEIAAIFRAAQALPQHPKLKASESVNPPRLGYSGIRVKAEPSMEDGLVGFAVYRRNLQLHQRPGAATAGQPDAPQASEARIDDQATLERRLLGLLRARGAITEEMVQAILAGKM